MQPQVPGDHRREIAVEDLECPRRPRLGGRQDVVEGQTRSHCTSAIDDPRSPPDRQAAARPDHHPPEWGRAGLPASLPGEPPGSPIRSRPSASPIPGDGRVLLEVDGCEPRAGRRHPGVLLLSPLAFSACSAGQVTQTASQERDKVGAMAEVGDITCARWSSSTPAAATTRRATTPSSAGHRQLRPGDRRPRRRQRRGLRRRRDRDARPAGRRRPGPAGPTRSRSPPTARCSSTATSLDLPDRPRRVAHRRAVDRADLHVRERR